MSLNGLDAPALTEAFGKACAEPGNWFWIKYISRDDVELLCQGANGTEEMREAAAKEPDDSPLYGFIQFRRRNILIKYIPEDTSRVLKARSQVHFQSVVEKFVPNDTTFSITSPKELRDNALTSVCSTHTATASISSSNSSLRARRLTDIAESADEEEPPATEVSGSPMAFGRLGGSGKSSQGLAVVITAHDSPVTDGGPGSPVFLDADRDLLGSPLSASFSRDSHEPRRKSSGSAPRPSTTDLYGYNWVLKEKVRLGPRPVVEPVKRPHTSGERSKAFPGPDQEIRPVVSVPKSVNIPPRKAKEPRTRSLSNESLRSQQSIPETHAIPLFLFATEIESSPPPPVRSLSPNPPQDGPPVLTPEKQRLMKALQLRRKMMIPELKEQARQDEESALDVALNIKESDETRSIAETDKGEDEGEDRIVSHKVVEPGPSGMGGGPEGMDVVEEEEQIPEIGETRQDSSEQGKPPKSTPEDDQPVESTKVRGEPDSDVDTESDHTEVSIMTDSRHVTMKAIQQPTPSIIKIPQTPQPAKALSPEPSILTPKVLKRVDRSGPSDKAPSSEIPAVETARSVSVPFLRSARDPIKPPAIIRKATAGGGGGGVAQRIRQLEMLSAQKAASAAAAKSTPVSRSNSPTPTAMPQFNPSRPTSINVPVTLRRMSNPPPLMRPTSSRSTALTPPLTAPGDSLARSSPLKPVASTPSLPTLPKSSSPPKPSPPPKMEIIERNNRPELQVTTLITRDEKGSPQPQPRSPVAVTTAIPAAVTAVTVTVPATTVAAAAGPESAKSKKSPLSFSRRSSVDALSPDSISRRKSIDVGPPSLSSSRRQSIDRGVLSRSSSSKDLGNLPENAVSPTLSTASSKKSKKDKEKERRGSSSSSSSSRERSKSKSPTSLKAPKSPNFLKRMSSSLKNLKPKEEMPTPTAPVAPAKPAKETSLLNGCINVQLPDTMLWRRRYLKINSDGWLFLSLTDNEKSPQARRYHIPKEVRCVDLPDVDEQELPYSVRIHFQEGGTLQCACQNGSEQKEVLGVIRGCMA